MALAANVHEPMAVPWVDLDRAFRFLHLFMVVTGVPARIFGLRHHVISTFGRDLTRPLFKSVVGNVPNTNAMYFSLRLFRAETPGATGNMILDCVFPPLSK